MMMAQMAYPTNGKPANLMAKAFMICYESAYPLPEKNHSAGTEEDRQMLYHFLSPGSSGILTYWIRGGMQKSSETIVKLILELCSGAAVAFENNKI